jgi:hypothetical protein
MDTRRMSQLIWEITSDAKKFPAGQAGYFNKYFKREEVGLIAAELPVFQDLLRASIA